MPPKKKQQIDNSAYKALKQDISAGTIRKLYLFHGDETYLRDYYLEQMKKRLLPEGMESFNSHTLGGKNFTCERLSELIDNLPMMSERTLIVVTDYDLYKAPEEERRTMSSLLADLPDYCCLVFIYDIIEYKSDARMKQLSSAIKENGSVVKFDRQSQGDLTDWIRRRFLALNHAIAPADAQYLIFLCGDLMTGLISEIEKIGAYAKQKQVTREDIDAVAIPQLDAVVFQMTDALTQKNFDKAASVLGDLFAMQQAPIMILSVLGKHFRQLLTARLAFDEGKNASYLMELWEMRSSYPAERLMSAAKHFGPEWCRNAVIRCAKTDLAMKSVVGADSRDLLISLLLELSVEERNHATN
jgi:DNA polymerase-3 subunit delta